MSKCHRTLRALPFFGAALFYAGSRVSIEDPFVSSLMGKRVAHVWRGHGSALFLEFGHLHKRRPRRDGSDSAPYGELTLMIQWSWRIERPRSILAGSWSEERLWSKSFDAILGAEVVGVQFLGALPEVVVILSNGVRVASFMTAEGQPEWSLINRTDSLKTLCVKRGRLAIEIGTN